MSDLKAQDVIPTRMADMPLRYPRWVKWGYIALVVALAWFAMDGGLNAFFAVILTAGFSFQFWTFAAWRGMIGTVQDKLDEAAKNEDGTEDTAV